jgi:hypothetical protein
MKMIKCLFLVSSALAIYYSVRARIWFSRRSLART